MNYTKEQQDIIGVKEGAYIVTAAPGCLTGDTIIKINRAKKSFKITLQNLYLKFNDLDYKNTRWQKNIKTKVRSLHNNNIIKLHDINGVVKSGTKRIYLLELDNGYQLKVTKEHKIMTKNGWKKLITLKNDDLVMIDTLYRHKKTSNRTLSDIRENKRKNISKERRVGEYHKYAMRKKQHGKYVTIVYLHRLIYEAKLNNLDLKTFIKLTYTEEGKKLKYLDPKKYHIHHKDENYKNNNKDNLKVTTPQDHNRYHISDFYKQFNHGLPEYSKIKYVKSLDREEMTFDIVCEEPHHNFVANGIVVHNSGKTACVTERVTQLIKSGVPSYQILAVTFTNKAAEEMKKRIAEKVGEHDATICTFHSLAYKAFLLNIKELNYKDFDIVPIKYYKNTAINIYKDMFRNTSRKSINEINTFVTTVSLLKKANKDPEFELEQPWVEIYKTVETVMRTNNKVTFDDLLFKVCRLFSNRRDLLERFRSKFKYILIDEAQDTNVVQFYFIYLLNHTNNIMITGDVSQAIMRFQGADIENIFGFQSKFTPKILPLSINFRSTKSIIKVVNKIMDYSLYDDEFKIHIGTDNEEGEKPELILYSDVKEQAREIAERIQSFVASGYDYKDFTILYRNNANSFDFEREFILRDMPFVVKSGSFINAKEVQLMLACLKISNPDFENEKMTDYISICDNFNNDVSEKTMQLVFTFNDMPFEELVRSGIKVPGIGPKRKQGLLDLVDFIDEVKQNTPKHKLDYIEPNCLYKTSKIVSEVISTNAEDEIEFQRRMDNVHVFIELFKEYFKKDVEKKDLNTFINDFTLRFTIDGDEPDDEDEEENAIILSTIHSYKGLEREVVFVVNIRDGVFPMFLNDIDEQEYMDSLNLFYVACSRAKSKMFLSAPIFYPNWSVKKESYSLLQMFADTKLIKNIDLYAGKIMSEQTDFYLPYYRKNCKGD